MRCRLFLFLFGVSAPVRVYVCDDIPLPLLPLYTLYATTTTTFMLSICVLILLYMERPHTAIKGPHTAVGVSLYCCVCVLILLYICPHTAV
jgi:hypothetical protein